MGKNIFEKVAIGTFIAMEIAVILILVISHFYQFGYGGKWQSACYSPTSNNENNTEGYQCVIMPDFAFDKYH